MSAERDKPLDGIWTKESNIIPKVDESREFLEIASDFTNPLEIVREAISNAFDWGARHIKIFFDVVAISGENILKIQINDDGEGMDREGLQAFFDLGNSIARKHPGLIGEKGHGTKVYFNSNRIEVVTLKNGKAWRASMDKPFARLHEGEIPTVNIESQNYDPDAHGTLITIYGYNSNRRDRFTHAILTDYILWFTKYGGIDEQFGENKYSGMDLELKGVDRSEPERVPYGHVFPHERKDINKLLEEYKYDASDYYVRKWIKNGCLRNFPEITYHAVFYVEGDKIKREYNKMLTRPGPGGFTGQYTVAERYGLWLCKDFIPIQRKNEWISTKGFEFTRFHAFINCQGFKLTANRGSIENTPAEILDDLRNIVESLYRDITTSSDWSDLDWLRQEASGYRGKERDEKELAKRIKICKGKKIAKYKDHILVEPRQEIGVYGLVVQLNTIEPEIFPFQIIDYDSHVGVDAIVKTRDKIAIGRSNLRMVEFKFSLGKTLNHLYDSIHTIVCWETTLRHEDEVSDVGNNTRRFTVVPKAFENDYDRYFLDDPRSTHRIEVIALSEYLPSRLGIKFSGRLEDL
jgi:hypothetical protein